MKQRRDPMKKRRKTRKKQEPTTDPQEQRQSFTGSIPSSKKTKDEKGMALSSESIIYPGKDDCYSYFRTGTCRYGRSVCIFNHPPTLPQELRERAYRPVCKYFLGGHCKKGSNCDLQHTMNRDGAEPMPQSISESATESRQGFEASGFKRPRIPVNPSVNPQENLHEQRQGNIKRQRREAQENLQQQRLMRYQEMAENENEEAHIQQNREEQRKREIERQRREARLRLDQMRPTALFDESSRPRELMKEFGHKDAKGI